MKRDLLYKFLIFLLFLSNANIYNGLFAQGQDPNSITIEKCQDFRVMGDGRCDKWDSTAWVNLVKQGPDPSVFHTRVKMLYSGRGIYFLFDCEDKKLISTMKSDNLNLSKEDVVEVFLWTDETFPVYFEYELSPLNYELVLIVPNDRGTFYGWLPWRYEGERKTRHRTSVIGGKKKSEAMVSGWIAEFFIPFKLLAPLRNVPPLSGTKWRVNMYRIDYDNGVTYFVWQKIMKSFHEYNNFGTFVFE